MKQAHRGDFRVMTATGYVMGGTITERDRLLAQATSQAPEARWLLERLGIKADWATIDLGCGPIGILDLLAERIGQGGAVVGIEREPRFVEMAHQVIGEHAFTNVEVVQADATATGLPPNSFDFAHARLVLLHQRDPRPLLIEMLRLVRPGGWVALQEIDAASFACEPAHPAWTRLWEAALRVTRDFGADVHLGRRLPGILRGAGLADVEAEAHTRLVRPGEVASSANAGRGGESRRREVHCARVAFHREWSKGNGVLLRQAAHSVERLDLVASSPTLRCPRASR